MMQYIRDEIGSDGSMDPEPMLRHCVGNVMNSIVFGFSWTPDDKMWHWLQKLQEEGTKHIGVAGPLNFLPFLRFAPLKKVPTSPVKSFTDSSPNSRKPCTSSSTGNKRPTNSTNA